MKAWGRCRAHLREGRLMNIRHAIAGPCVAQLCRKTNSSQKKNKHSRELPYFIHFVGAIPIQTSHLPSASAGQSEHNCRLFLMAQGHHKERDQEIPDVWTVYRVKGPWRTKHLRSSSGFLSLFLGLSRILTHGLIRKARSGRKKLIPDFMFA